MLRDNYLLQLQLRLHAQVQVLNTIVNLTRYMGSTLKKRDALVYLS
jgi:hypothetical protein